MSKMSKLIVEKYFLATRTFIQAKQPWLLLFMTIFMACKCTYNGKAQLKMIN